MSQAVWRPIRLGYPAAECEESTLFRPRQMAALYRCTPAREGQGAEGKRVLAMEPGHDPVASPDGSENGRDYAGVPCLCPGPKGLSGRNRCTLARAPWGQMGGAATQAMPLRIFQERQQSRCPRAGAPLRAGVRRHAGVVTRSLHTAQRVCASLAPSQRTWGPQQSISVTS